MAANWGTPWVNWELGTVNCEALLPFALFCPALPCPCMSPLFTDIDKPPLCALFSCLLPHNMLHLLTSHILSLTFGLSSSTFSTFLTPHFHFHCHCQFGRAFALSDRRQSTSLKHTHKITKREKGISKMVMWKINGGSHSKQCTWQTTLDPRTSTIHVVLLIVVAFPIS